MKKVVFLCSHLYSGSSVLYSSLNNHSRIQGFAGHRTYNNPMNLLELTSQKHKVRNRGAIYLDEILYNQNFSLAAAYKTCSFIYLIREPDPTVNFLINDKIQAKFAARIYAFRLRRICEMARHTPGAVLLTWKDLKAGKIDLINEYLNLKDPIILGDLSAYEREFSTNLMGYDIWKKLDHSYERYLHFLKQLPLRICND